LFQGKLDTVVPEHGPADQEIPLKEGTHPRMHKVYPANPQ